MSSLLLLALEAARACSCPQYECTPSSALEIRERRNASVRSATDLVVGVVEDRTVTDICDRLLCLPPLPYRATVRLALSDDGEPTVRELTWVERRPSACSCSCPTSHVAWAEGGRMLFWQLPSGAWDWHPIPTNRACAALASHPRPSAAVRCLGATRPAAKW
ncbi:MAG: hypothetical protein ABMA64_15205 [Myxococcota bacterium]